MRDRLTSSPQVAALHQTEAAAFSFPRHTTPSRVIGMITRGTFKAPFVGWGRMTVTGITRKGSGPVTVQAAWQTTEQVILGCKRIVRTQM